MQLPKSGTLIAILGALGSLPAANAECFNGKERRPKNNIATLSSILVAASNMQDRGVMADKDNVWAHSLVGNGDGGETCPNFGIDNTSGGYRSTSVDTAVQGLLAEWIVCKNGGKIEYKSGELSGWRFM